MQEYRNQICFVSGQNVAELLGALLPGAGTSLHAIVTPQMKSQALWLQNTCKKNQVKCVLHDLPEIKSAAIESLMESIWYNEPEASWAVNLTGGNKMMGFAAYDWAKKAKVPVFYIDTGSRAIFLREPTEPYWQEQALPSLLHFEQLLNLYGYDVESKTIAQVDAATRNAISQMLELAGRPKGITAVGALNKFAKLAEDDCTRLIDYIPEESLNALLAICKTAGKLDHDGSHLCFKDEKSRKWCNGIWLEEYAQAVLAGLKADGRISSWASSVNVRSNGVPNELDAVFTVDNRLHVLECKTPRLRDKDLTAASILYKADSIKDRVGGIYTRYMLCSLDDLNQDQMRRAKNLQIETVLGANLKNLREILLRWIERG